MTNSMRLSAMVLALSLCATTVATAALPRGYRPSPSKQARVTKRVLATLFGVSALVAGVAHQMAPITHSLELRPDLVQAHMGPERTMAQLEKAQWGAMVALNGQLKPELTTKAKAAVFEAKAAVFEARSAVFQARSGLPLEVAQALVTLNEQPGWTVSVGPAGAVRVYTSHNKLQNFRAMGKGAADALLNKASHPVRTMIRRLVQEQPTLSRIDPFFEVSGFLGALEGAPYVTGKNTDRGTLEQYSRMGFVPTVVETHMQRIQLGLGEIGRRLFPK